MGRDKHIRRRTDGDLLPVEQHTQGTPDYTGWVGMEDVAGHLIFVAKLPKTGSHPRGGTGSLPTTGEEQRDQQCVAHRRTAHGAAHLASATRSSVAAAPAR